MSDPDITITNITAGDIAEFRTLLAKLGDGDITAIRVQVDDTDYIARLADDPDLRWIARRPTGRSSATPPSTGCPAGPTMSVSCAWSWTPRTAEAVWAASSFSTHYVRRCRPGCARWWWN